MKNAPISTPDASGTRHGETRCRGLHVEVGRPKLCLGMQQVKDTLRATVRIAYDGRVYKTFRGPRARERFENEVAALRHLQERGCPFVPILLESDPAQLRIVTTNCGNRVERIDDARVREIFDELLPYGVRHDDAEARNITYRVRDGRFCVIDFEFATLFDPAGPVPPPRPPEERRPINLDDA